MSSKLKNWVRIFYNVATEDLRKYLFCVFCMNVQFSLTNPVLFSEEECMMLYCKIRKNR